MGRTQARERLTVDAINVDSVHCDWADLRGEDGEGWVSFEAGTCDKCGAVLILGPGDGGDTHAHVENGSTCPGYVGQVEGPMMNYYYPLPHFDQKYHAAEKLEGLPLALVQFRDGSWALALTGGGMDLSWEICAGFIRLGYLPPLKYCTSLPQYGGDTYARRREVLRYSLQACQVAAGWARDGARRIREHRRKLYHQSRVTGKK